MKNSCTIQPTTIVPIILPLLLPGATGLHASILFSEGFETDGEGVRYTSTSSFTDGADDYFTRTDGFSEASGIPAYTGFSGSFYWAAEDVDSTDNPSGLAQIDISGIDVSSFDAVLISIDLGAGSNAVFDNANDHLFVQYRVEDTDWTTALAFQNDGSSFNSGLYQDTDLDDVGDGSLVDISMATFTSAILPMPGNTMDLRIETLMTSGSEAVAFDNIQVMGIPEPSTTALALAIAAASILLFKQPFLPQRKDESRA